VSAYLICFITLVWRLILTATIERFKTFYRLALHQYVKSDTKKLCERCMRDERDFLQRSKKGIIVLFHNYVCTSTTIYEYYLRARYILYTYVSYIYLYGIIIDRILCSHTNNATSCRIKRPTHTHMHTHTHQSLLSLSLSLSNSTKRNVETYLIVSVANAHQVLCHPFPLHPQIYVQETNHIFYNTIRIRDICSYCIL